MASHMLLRAVRTRPSSWTRFAIRLLQSSTRPTMPLTAHLECEQKFKVSAPLLGMLRDKQCPAQPLFSRPENEILVTSQPDRIIHDRYHDRDDTLSRQGIWVRQRSERFVRSVDFPMFERGDFPAVWEAKHRVTGDYTQSGFEEVHGKDAVRELLRKFLPGVAVQEIPIMANLETFRETWLVWEIAMPPRNDLGTKRFSVVIDTTTCANQGTDEDPKFKHVVGEVEITRDCELTGEAEADTKSKAQALAEMNQQIEEFMSRHPSLFPPRWLSPPVGKLSAYFAWKQSISGRV